MGARCAVLLSAVLCSLAVAGTASGSAFPGKNGQLVFAEENATTSFIATSTATGGGIQTLSTPPSGFADSQPRVSADGNWILFERNGFTGNTDHLMIMRADGSCLSDISTGISGANLSDTSPSFAPDGSYVVFDRFDTQAFAYTGVFKETLSLNCSGGSITPGTVTQLTTGQDHHPTVSPDGTHIAFSRDTSTDTEIVTAPLSNPANPTPITSGNGDYYADYSPDGSTIAFSRNFNSIYTVNANATGVVTPTQLVAPSSFGSVRPAFSPDGTTVLYEHRDPGVGPGGSPPEGLWTVPAAGGTPTEIQTLAGTSSVAFLYPDWAVARPASCTTPLDGKLVFESPNATPGISTGNPDGSGAQQIITTPSGFFDNSPRVSPDGTQIAFERDDNQNARSYVYITSANGSNPTNLTSSLASNVWAQTPTFSADGSKIVFVESVQGTSTGLYIMGTDGSGVTQLLSGNYTSPTISPDGTKIAFVNGSGSIELASFNSSTETVGTPTVVLSSTTPGLSGFAQQLDFSPAGTAIAFSDSYDIWTVPTGGGTPTKLTGNVFTGGYNGQAEQPAFSPDGANLAYEEIQYHPSFAAAIHLMHADGSGDVPVIAPSTGVGGPGIDWQTAPCGSLGAVKVSKAAAHSTATAGASDSYTITISNPNSSSVSLNQITDTLPNGFTYTPGSSSGAIPGNPAVSGQQLTWSGSFNVPAGGSVTETLGVKVSAAPGTYYNSAGAGGGSAETVPSGAVAPVQVTAPADSTSTSVSCTPSSGTAGSPISCKATVTDTASSPTTPTGGVQFTTSPNVFTGSCGLPASGSGASSSCSLSVGSVAVGTYTVTAQYSGDATHAPSSGHTQLTANPVPSTLTVHIAFSCPSTAAPCGAPYPPNQAPQPGAGRVLGTTSLGAGKNIDCWGPQAPPGFVEGGGFVQTCTEPVTPGQTFNLSAYANTYGSGHCSPLFCPGTGWPPWKVVSFASSSNVTGCSGLGATCAAKMGSGQNDVTVTLVPADQPPTLGTVVYALIGNLCGAAATPGCVKLYSGQVWDFADGAADLDHDPNVTESWDWGDGTTGCPANVKWNYLCTGGMMAHPYVLPAGASGPQTFTITVTAVDSDGLSAPAKHTTITIWPLPPSTTVSFSKPLGSSVATTAQPGGSATTTAALPSAASSVTATVTLGGSSGAADTAAAKVLTKVVKRHVKAGGLVLKLNPTNKKLFHQLKGTMHRSHKHTQAATLTLVIKLSGGKVIRVVQHIKLLF